MSRTPLRLPAALVAFTLVSGLAAVASADDLQTASVLMNRARAPLKSVHVTASDNSGAVTPMLCGQSSSGYNLTSGKVTVVLALSKIENVDMISFLNSGAVGSVTIFTSNTKLPTGSDKWQQVGQETLGSGAVQATVGPMEAKYIKMTFDVSDAGRIAGLNVWALGQVAPSMRVAAVSANRANYESDGKEIADGKDLGDNKEIPAEAPAEGPPPPLPDPPPFTFIPEIVPTSP